MGGKAGRLPKRIRKGMKQAGLPKELRDGAKRVAALAASPAGRELIAGGLALAAAAIRAQTKAARDTPGMTPTAPASPSAIPLPPPATGPAPQPAMPRDPHEIGAELARMAEAALAGLFGGRKRD